MSDVRFPFNMNRHEDGSERKRNSQCEYVILQHPQMKTAASDTTPPPTHPKKKELINNENKTEEKKNQRS